MATITCHSDAISTSHLHDHWYTRYWYQLISDSTFLVWIIKSKTTNKSWARELIPAILLAELMAGLWKRRNGFLQDLQMLFKWHHIRTFTASVWVVASSHVDSVTSRQVLCHMFASSGIHLERPFYFVWSLDGTHCNTMMTSCGVTMSKQWICTECVLLACCKGYKEHNQFQSNYGMTWNLW